MTTQRSDRVASARWGDLRLRVLSAIVLTPLAIFCLWAGGFAFAALGALAAAAMGWEWLMLCQLETHVSSAGRATLPGSAVVPFLALPLSVLIGAYRGAPLALALLAIATLVAIVQAGGLSRGRPLAFGIPYIGLAAVSLVWLRQPASGAANVIVLLLVIWASDIGAYLVGRLVGGPRLAPSISPGKTWSGAVGGLLAAALTAMAAAATLGGAPFSIRPIALAVLIAIVGQIGDLFESQLKRHFGVKDSSKIIPGHGGALDRLDAVLTAAPVAALLVLALGRGVVLWK